MKNNKKVTKVTIPWKTLREKAGLTQKEVSSALGYSTPQFISNVERGRCRFPVPKLARVRKLYRLSVDQMVDLVMREERETMQKTFRRT